MYRKRIKNSDTKKVSRRKAMKKIGVTTLTASTLMFLSTKSYAGSSGNDVGTNAAKPASRGRPSS